MIRTWEAGGKEPGNILERSYEAAYSVKAVLGHTDDREDEGKKGALGLSLFFTSTANLDHLVQVSNLGEAGMCRFQAWPQTPASPSWFTNAKCLQNQLAACAVKSL